RCVPCSERKTHGPRICSARQWPGKAAACSSALPATTSGWSTAVRPTSSPARRSKRCSGSACRPWPSVRRSQPPAPTSWSARRGARAARDVGLAYLLDDVTGAPGVIFEKPIPAAGDFFGAAVAADGDEVLVGAPLDSGAAPNAGAAYLFRRDTATLERAFQSPAPAPGD